MTSLQKDAGTFTLCAEGVDGGASRSLLDDVVAEDDADIASQPSPEMFAQRSGSVGDTTFTLLIRVGDVLETEMLARIAQRGGEIA